MTEFGTLSQEGGYVRKGSLKQSSMLKCPHFIMVFEHYREDESCKCDDPTATEMADWGYTWDGKRWS